MLYKHKLRLNACKALMATGSKYVAPLDPSVVTNALPIAHLQCKHALKRVSALRAVRSVYKPPHSRLRWNSGYVTVPSVPSLHHSDV